MSWYVLQCRIGSEQTIVRSCRQHLSGEALESAFTFRCERLWKSDKTWKTVEKDMFPGYVFLQSSNPSQLSKELDAYRKILKVMEEDGYLLSVYQEEEQYLRELCGDEHFLKMSFGYRDREKGISHITEGPLKAFEDRIIRIDWHRRYAQLEVLLARKKAVVWAGLGIDEKSAEEMKALVS